jgi:LysR family transcriptional regulator, transcriptional activator of nhaA
MEWLNYHHLLYFWTVVREGTVARAGARLSLAQPTISGQLRTLETMLGEKLFTRSGRRLVLTETGRLVYRYADEIFSIGREMMETLKGRPSGRPLKLTVGIADAVPKLIAYRLLQPALALPEPVHLICREDKPDKLLAELAVHALDLVLTDAPMAPSVRVRAYTHLLGECGLSFFGAPALATRYRKGFPKSLDGAPMLLPTDNTALRRSLDEWFDATKIHPAVIGEFDDSALLKVFGETGRALFPAPTAIEREVRKQYNVALVGRADTVRSHFYAVSVERRLKHPAVVAIVDVARKKLFG